MEDKLMTKASECSDGIIVSSDLASIICIAPSGDDDFEDSSLKNLGDDDNNSLISSSSSSNGGNCKKRTRSESDGDENHSDLAAKQKKRRQIRMEILKRKRQQNKRNGNGSNCCSSPMNMSSSALTDEELFTSDTSSSSSSCALSSSSLTSLENIKDPQLLRKLRNRESAARSRQKVIDLIDSLTFDLMDRYVAFQDLQEQYDFLTNFHSFDVCTSNSSVYNSQYPSGEYEISPEWTSSIDNSGFIINNNDNNNSSYDHINNSSCASRFPSSLSSSCSPFYPSSSSSSCSSDDEGEYFYEGLYNEDNEELNFEMLTKELLL